MNKLWIILFLMIFCTNVLAAEAAYVPGEIMVQLTRLEDDALKSLELEFEQIKLSRSHLLSRRMQIWLFTFAPKRWPDSEVKQRLKDHPHVLNAQFNHYISQRQLFPDDEFFDLQWNMHNDGSVTGVADADIDAPEAWDLNTGGVTVQGDTLVIAILDGGCDIDHSDLNFYKNENEIPNNGVDDDNNGYIDDYDGWNAYTHTGFIPNDSHGTHVSGISGAIGNNGMGVSGVCWNARIMPVAAESTVESIVVEGYGYVLEMRQLWNETNGDLGAFVVSTNASFGVDFGQPSNYPLWSAIYDSLGVAGVLSSAATMNSHQNIDVCGDMPTACESDYLITVTNTTSFDEKHSMAAYGLVMIDLGAPGTSVYSTNFNNAYCYKTGTSMAAPHLAGAVALMISTAEESWLQEYVADPTKCLEIKDYLLDGVDTLPDLMGATVSGGRLNLVNSINLFNGGSFAASTLPPLEVNITNYPNPFNPSTTISFSLNSEITDNTELGIYNLKGQKIKTLDCHPEPVERQGAMSSYTVVWNGTDHSGKPVSSGIYFARLKDSNHINTKKMLLMK